MFLKPQQQQLPFTPSGLSLQLNESQVPSDPEGSSSSEEKKETTSGTPDANCSCQEPDFPHSKLAMLDEKISSPRWVVPVLPQQELEVLMNAAIQLCRTGKNYVFY